MTKKEKAIPKTIPNYHFNDVQAISIDLHRFTDEDSDEVVYNPSVMLHFNIEEDTGRTLESTVLITHVSSPDPKEIIQHTLDSMTALFQCPVYNSGHIFSDDGEIVEEFDLNEMFGSDEDQDTEYDLANMEMNKPIIH